MAKDNNSIGIAGEHLAAFELARRGYIAAFTLKNTARVDLLVSDGCKAVPVQVKTNRVGAKRWICPAPGPSSGLMYIFVSFKIEPGFLPCFYIVPAHEVRKIVQRMDRDYRENYLKRYEKPFTGRGVPTFALTEAEAVRYQDKWSAFGLTAKDISAEAREPEDAVPVRKAGPQKPRPRAARTAQKRSVTQ